MNMAEEEARPCPAAGGGASEETVRLLVDAMMKSAPVFFYPWQCASGCWHLSGVA